MTSLQIAIGVWGMIGVFNLYETRGTQDFSTPRFVLGSLAVISTLWFWIELARMAL